MNDTCKKHVDSCRFCWMCRHICPIGNATGLERNTARARALGLSLVNRNTYDLSEVIDNVYECACCSACTQDCATGWDPVLFIKAARLDAALSGKTPDYINSLVDHCLDDGNAYGVTVLDAELQSAIEKHSTVTDTLLLLGADARCKAPACAVSAIHLLEELGVTFTVLADEPSTGAQLDFLIGAAEETRQQMLACASVLSAYDNVIIYDPQDAAVIKHTYEEWEITPAVRSVTFTSYLAQLLKNAPEKVRQTGRKVVFQDPFQLSRTLSETEPAREILRLVASPAEMLNFGKHTMWAGGILMGQWMGKVMNAVANNRIQNAIGVKADTLITASVSEYVSLKAVDQKDVTIISLEDLLLSSLA